MTGTSQSSPELNSLVRQICILGTGWDKLGSNPPAVKYDTAEAQQKRAAAHEPENAG
jgi:hypothetical protein